MPGISRLFFLAVLANIGHRSLSSSGAPLENPFPLGTIGCLASDVCGPQEVCKDDLLFGSCQEPRGSVRSALGSRGPLDPHHRHGPDVFHLQTVEIEELEQTIWTLIRDGFTWQDAYTQCTLQNLLVAFKRGRRFSPRLCEIALGVRLPARGSDGAAESADWAGASSAEIAAVLKELMKAQDGGDLRAADHLRGQDAYAAGGDPVFERDSRRIAGPFPDEDAREDEERVEEGLPDYEDFGEDEEGGLDLLGSNKRDEFVQVHKYFDTSKGQLKRDPYLAEGRRVNDPYTGYLAAYRRQQALTRAASGAQRDDALGLDLDALASAGAVERDPGFPEVRDPGSSYLSLEQAEEGKAVKEEGGKFFDLPPDMVEVEASGRETVASPDGGENLGLDSKPSPQSQGAETTVDRPLTLSPRDEATLERLLQGTVEPDQLPVDQQRRLSSFIEAMIARLEQRGGDHEKDLQGSAVLSAGAQSGPADGQATGGLVSPVFQPRESEDGDRLQGPVNSDLQLDKKSPALPEEESADEATKEKNKAVVHTEYTYLILNNNLTPEQAETFVTNLTHLLHVPEGVANLNEVNGDQVIIKLAQDPQWNSSKLAREAQDNAEALYQETGLKVVDAGIGKGVTVEVAKKDRGYVVLTFILVGSIAGVVLAVTIIYLIKRHRRSRDKLAQLAATGDGNEASKDYQDLCRQRMQSKASEKPEPLHAASRIGSVSESQVRSPSSRSSTSSWSEEPAASNMDISTGHVVLAYMEDHLRNQDRLDQEWEALAAYQADPCSTAIASDPANARKNRYSDVLPYDHSRVVLAAATNVNNSDYINASFITDHDPRNPAYICTQGPLPHTVADFWQMVWEQGSVVIVMLTKLHAEDGSALCHRYWPEEGSDLYHIYEVHLVSEHIWCDDYLVRSFYLKNLQTNETRTVTQFHFLTWTHLTVPPSMKALLDFRRKVNKSFRGGSCPIVVHCNDGCGRSGTYVLVDMVLNRMAKGAKEIDMAATLEHIRDQRMNMVQTKEQFQFALSAVAEEVHAILKAMPQ